jgi:hypothetical protein
MQSIKKDPSHCLCLGPTEPLSNEHNPPICKGKIIKHESLATRKASFTSNQKDIKFLTIMNPNMYFRSEQQSKEHQVQACAGATKVPKASVQ